MPILWDVMEEHLEESAFLWTAWERALHSPLYTVTRVAAGPEERLLAHLDALLLGGPPVTRRLLAPALSGDEAGKAFAAASAMIEAGKLAAVLAALQSADQAPRGGIRRALELSTRPEIDAHLLPLAAEAAPEVQAAALEALAFRGADPGEALRKAAGSPHPAVTAGALRAARFSPSPWARSLVLGALSSPDAGVRQAAIETGLVLGLGPAWTACVRSAEASPTAPLRLLLAVGGEPADQEPLLAAARGPDPDPDALWALGFGGRVAGADACVAAMQSGDPRVARLAGEAFSAITGLQLVEPYVAAEPPEPEEPVPFEKEDLEASLEPGPEAALPLPDAFGVELWWKKSRARFDQASRYLDGRPLDADAVAEALRAGPMRRRHPLALELEIRSQGAVRICARRWARQQLLLPEGVRALQPGLLSRPLRALAKGA